MVMSRSTTAHQPITQHHKHTSVAYHPTTANRTFPSPTLDMPLRELLGLKARYQKHQGKRESSPIRGRSDNVTLQGANATLRSREPPSGPPHRARLPSRRLYRRQAHAAHSLRPDDAKGVHGHARPARCRGHAAGRSGREGQGRPGGVWCCARSAVGRVSVPRSFCLSKLSPGCGLLAATFARIVHQGAVDSPRPDAGRPPMRPY